jgi:hypothetical protein
MELNDEGMYRLAAAVMGIDGDKLARHHGDEMHRHQLAWLKGPCGVFWMNAMALISEDITSRYASAYGVASGPATWCTNGHIGKNLSVLH